MRERVIVVTVSVVLSFSMGFQKRLIFVPKQVLSRSKPKVKSVMTSSSIFSHTKEEKQETFLANGTINGTIGTHISAINKLMAC